MFTVFSEKNVLIWGLILLKPILMECDFTQVMLSQKWYHPVQVPQQSLEALPEMEQASG